MPTAYIYRGTFEVRAGETLRYREIVPDGTISPEVTKTYAELAGSGSIAAASVSLTPTVSAPTLTGVQIGAIEGVSVSLQPTVSPAAVSGVQVGSIAAASVSLRPTVAAPSVTGVRVGSINAAAVSLQPTVATGTLTGGVAQTGSINAAAVTCRPTVAVGTLTGVAASTTLTESFTGAFSGFPYVGEGGISWNAPSGSVSGGNLNLPVNHYQDPDTEEEFWTGTQVTATIPSARTTGNLRIKARSASGAGNGVIHLDLNGATLFFYPPPTSIKPDGTLTTFTVPYDSLQNFAFSFDNMVSDAVVEDVELSGLTSAVAAPVVTLTRNGAAIAVSWGAVSGATKYLLIGTRDSSEPSFAKLTTSTGTAVITTGTSGGDGNPAAGTYKYAVAAIDAQGYFGPLSNVVSTVV